MEETGGAAAPHTTFKHVSERLGGEPLNTDSQVNTTCRNPLTTTVLRRRSLAGSDAPGCLVTFAVS